MKKIVLASLIIVVTGCANVMQSGSITDAYKHYEKQDYEETLKLITLAASIDTPSPELLAELTYLKAQTYEQMGQAETARTLYAYIKDQHKDTQYGYLAAKFLENDDE